MKKNSTILSNLLSHFPRSDFENAVCQFSGDLRIRTLSCFELFKGLFYGQVTGAFSVREIESSLAANASNLYRSGMKPIKRSTFCDAMENRDHQIFEKTFEALVGKAKQLTSASGKRFRNPLKIIDASTIELNLARFDWAKFRTTKGAVKLHIALNGDYCFPEQVRLTTGNVHEINQLSSFAFSPDDITVMDRGYVDFKRLHDIDMARATFVTRMKDNCQHELVSINSFSENQPVRLDARVRLTSEKGRANYPNELRQVIYHDDEFDRYYVFMTNNFELSAQEVADIYKARWQVELFFKWIKQNLKIKTFWGTSLNAVFTQIWVALIVVLLLWINKVSNGISVSLQRFLQILKTTILAQRPLEDLFREPVPPERTDLGQYFFWGAKS